MTIYAAPGASFEATAEGFDSGLAGTLGVRILDNVGGTFLARTTAGISELVAGSGVYAVTLTAPTDAGEFTLIWDDTGSGPEHTAAEPLSIIENTTVQVISGTSGMSYGDILDNVLGNPLRFEDDMRERAGRAVNLRYAHVWGLEDWTFRFAIDTPTVTAGNPVLQGVESDFGVPVYLWRDDGELLTYLEQGEFQLRYLPADTGPSECWTIVDGSVYLGPTPSASATWRSYYRRRLSALVDEAAYPMLPPEYHLMLVHGGRAELLSVSDDPMVSMMEAQWQQDIEAMKREYLTDAVGQPDYWPSDLMSLVRSWP